MRRNQKITGRAWGEVKHLVVFYTCRISGSMKISYFKFFSTICCQTMCQYTNL
ncbi:hypothetical protein BGY98DRAFT_1020753 [Russula aff. rugulosa BPL654]|nr:hypothetical protein BGY98DRAFT_1020753 [Russula aff. rugulosa BPL654]